MKKGEGWDDAKLNVHQIRYFSLPSPKPHTLRREEFFERKQVLEVIERPNSNDEGERRDSG